MADTPGMTAASAVDFALGAKQSESAAAIRSNLSMVAGESPDKEANIQRLATASALPATTVRADPNAAAKTMAPVSIDTEKLATDSPFTADFLANIDNTRIAHDDVQALSGLENGLRGQTALSSLPPLSAGQRLLQARDNLFGVPDIRKARAADIAAAREQGMTLDEMKRNVFGAPNEFLAQTASGFVHDFSAGLVPTEITGDPQTTMGGIGRGAGGLGGFIAGLPMGLSKMAMAKLGIEGLEVKKTDDFVTALFKDVTKQSATLGTASAVSGIEGAVDSPDLATGLGKEAKTTAAGAATGALFGTTARVLPDDNVLSALGRFMLNSGAQDVATGAHPGDERPVEQQAYEYLLNGFFSLHGGGRVEGGFMKSRVKAATAERDGQNIQAINDAAVNSKLRPRSPQAFHDFVAKAAENGPAEDLYISPMALAQSGVKPEELAQLSPSAAEQLPNAQATGVDIRIPTAEFATNIAGTPMGDAMLEHLKTDPAGFSRAEAQEFMTKQGEQLRAEVEKTMEAKAADEPFMAQKQAVKDDIFANLNKVGRFTKSTNEMYAELTSSYFATQAARTGVTPEEFYKEHKTKIQADFGTKRGKKSAPILNQENYWGNHRPPNPEDGAPLHDLTGNGRIYPEDIYEKDAARIYGHGGNHVSIDKKAINIIQKIKDNPNAEITAYRAIPEGASESINSGDWVTITKEYAQQHLEGPLYGKGKIVEAKVKAKDLFTNGDSFHEYGYWKDGKIPDSFKQSVSGIFDRGAYDPDTNTLTLLKNADLSTYLHEMGHFMLENLNKLALTSAAPEIKADMDALLKSFGVAGDTPEARLAEWNKHDLEWKREHHETFARSFEAYLYEGKAPSVGLRKVFQTFRGWLLNIYQNLTALKVELKPEVREVFDRMLATNEQISEMQAVNNYEPLFKNAKEAGMDDAEFKAYHALGVQATQDAITNLEARSLRDMRWMSNAKGREVRRLQRDVASKRMAVRNEVSEEVMSQPINRAMEFIKKGTLDISSMETNKTQRRIAEEAGLTGTKLSTAALKEMYGDKDGAPWRDLPNNFKTAEGGLHPDMVAELFGFSSGDELVKNLIKAENPRETINALTDMRMLERYGDLNSPEAIERAAEEAIHNEVRTKFIATEMNALNKAIGGKKILAEAAKGYADQMIARLKVRNVKPIQYSTAEARAARAADKARRAGDLPLAATEKRNQLINNYASSAAYKALDDVEKAVRYFKKFDRPGVRENIDADYTDQIDALLERFDLRKSTTLKAIDKRKSLLDWVARQKDQGLEPNIPESMLNEANRKSYKDATVEELRGLVDTVKQIEHLGRLKERLLTAQDQRNFDAAKDAIVNGIYEHAPARNIDLRTRSNAGGDTLRGLNRFLALHRKMASVARQMDGSKDAGPMWEYFVRNMNVAGDKETQMRADATAKLSDLIQPLLTGERMGGKGEYFPSIDMSLNREERIGIALNTGNAGNLQRLLDGEGWTMEQIRPVLDRISPEEAQFVQNIWDFFESYRPEIGAKERRVYGTEPEWIDPTPVALGGKQLKGGYYPIKYDPQRSGKTQQHADAEDAKAMLKGAYTSATTKRSFTKTRADEVKERPLLYSLSGLYQGTNEVIHDLSWHEWLIDTNRLLRNKAIDQAIRTKYGAETVSLFKDAIRDIGQGDVPAQNVFERSVNHIRSGATMAGLAWNFGVSLMQPLGLSNSMVRIGPRWVAAGMKEWLKAPVDKAEEIYAKSSMMKNRASTMQREINEIKNRVSAGETGATGIVSRGLEKAGVQDATGKVVTARDWVEASMFYTIQKMQLVADIPTWLGQYQKSIAEGHAETKAIALADQAVLDAQGGGQLKDLSGIQRGGPLQKLFTNFYSYFNVLHNQGAEVTARTDWKDPASVAIAARDYMLLYIAPSVMASLLNVALKGDDGKGIISTIVNDEISYMMGTLVGLREITGAAQMAAGTAPYQQSYQGPAGLRLLSELYKLGSQVGQGDMDSALRRSALNTAGILFHLPSGQINKTWDGIGALFKGKAGPQALIVGPPPGAH